LRQERKSNRGARTTITPSYSCAQAVQQVRTGLGAGPCFVTVGAPENESTLRAPRDMQLVACPASACMDATCLRVPGPSRSSADLLPMKVDVNILFKMRYSTTSSLLSPVHSVSPSLCQSKKYNGAALY
jgi:hypothetical protein